MKQPKPKEPSEKQIQQAVIDHWVRCGVAGSLVAAIPNAHAFGQPGLTKGLFDLLVIGGSVGVAFMELKTKKGILSIPQREFKIKLIKAGVDYAVCYGRDEPIVALEAWGVCRKAAA